MSFETKKSAVFSILIALLFLQGCGGKYVKERIKPSRIEISGEISLRGSSPFPLLIIETPHGDDYILHAASPLLDELKRLSGMSASVEGVVNETRGGLPVISVDSYRLLPLKTGEEPVIGFIEVAGDTCYLAGDDGKKLRIEGEFREMFGEFAGAKVWVIGKRRGVDVIIVSGYGVLRPPSKR